MSSKTTSPHFAPTSPRELAISHLTSPQLSPPLRGEVGGQDGPSKQTLIQPDLWGEVKSQIVRRPSYKPISEFPRYRLDEYANRDRCWKCKSAVWVAICRTGFKVELDPEPITPEQELEFFIAKRRTYEVYKAGHRFMVEMRTFAQILRDNGSRPSLPAHKCDPDNIRKDCPDLWPLPARPETTEEVPF